MISIHAPLAGSDSRLAPECHRFRYFNPRSPCGERQIVNDLVYRHRLFQSTLPLRGATSSIGAPSQMCAFQSTLPLRGATRTHVSTHAPLPFQSTLPLRGATWHGAGDGQSLGHFNPRSPCGERRLGVYRVLTLNLFQSTLPLRGATYRLRRSTRGRRYFNPRSPCGERLDKANQILGGNEISIHAPLAGSDGLARRRARRPGYFNPRSPCGERPCGMSVRWQLPVFQSTLPLRGATGYFLVGAAEIDISIHAPLAGSDVR